MRFLTRSISDGVDAIAGKPPPTRSDGHDQGWGGLVYYDEREA